MRCSLALVAGLALVGCSAESYETSNGLEVPGEVLPPVPIDRSDVLEPMAVFRGTKTALLVGPDGTLIIIGVGNPTDKYDEQLLMSIRSSDGGDTWSKTTVIDPRTIKKQTPFTAFVDQLSGRTTLLYVEGSHSSAAVALRTYSDSYGRRWSLPTPVSLQGACSPTWRKSTQLLRGPHAGRFVMAGRWQPKGKYGDDDCLVVSDDGEHFRSGALHATEFEADEGEQRYSDVFESVDGAVVMVTQYWGHDDYALLRSLDGGETFSDEQEAAGLAYTDDVARYAATDWGAERNVIVSDFGFSEDEGRSWSSFGCAGCSFQFEYDLAVTHEGYIATLMAPGPLFAKIQLLRFGIGAKR